MSRQPKGNIKPLKKPVMETMMRDSQTQKPLEFKWVDADASKMSEPEKLLYRSNLLGSDKRITNYGGGNTSAKVMQADPLTGDEVEVLWVKGSGGDVGSIKMDGFSTLYMDKLNALRGIYRGAKHVDHMHPDAIIAIAAAKDSKALTQQIFGDTIGWLPWKKPGYELGLWLSDFCAKNPDAKGVVLESHGLFTWADDARDCYQLTLEIIQKAMDWFEEQTAGKTAFGGAVHSSLPAEERRNVAARLMPAIRGMVSGQQHMVGHFTDSDAVLEFVNANSCARKSALWWSISTPPSRMSTRRLQVSLTRWPRIARATLPITSAANMMTAPPSATPTRWSIWCRASA